MTAFLWTMAWQTALVALAAAAVASALRRQPAAARHRLFLGALLVAALLPAASAWLFVTLPRSAGADAVSVFVATAAPGRIAAVPAAPLGGVPFRLPGPGWVLGVCWVAAMMLQAAGLFRRWRRARLALRRASPERVVAGVPVLRGGGSPFTLGWLRPRIVLPSSLLDRETWASAALAHELAHVRRRDYLWAWLGELALVPLAWHPAARWLATQAALEREAACDESALAADSAYPTRLVDIAAAPHSNAAAHAGLCLAHRRDFERRIARLLAPPARRSRARLAVASAGFTVAVAAAWALGGGLRTRPVKMRAAASAATRQPGRQSVPVGANVEAAMCIVCATPVYPPEAKAAGLQGNVEMHIVIGTYGTVTNVNCGVGDPALLAAAQDAVRGWRYAPLRLNGQPVAVDSTVFVQFSLDNPGKQPLQGLRGVVCSAQGERVSGAAVSATAVGTDVATRGTTGADGAFALDLSDGEYEVRIQRRGFQERRSRITLPIEHAWLVVLRLGEASQSEASQRVLVNGGSGQR